MRTEQRTENEQRARTNERTASRRKELKLGDVVIINAFTTIWHGDKGVIIEHNGYGLNSVYLVKMNGFGTELLWSEYQLQAVIN